MTDYDLEEFNSSSYWSNDSVSENVTEYSAVSNRTSGPDPAYAFFLEASRFWVKRVCIPLVMCIGVIGNSITVVVLTRRRMRSSTNHYLTALAFFDMFYLILVFTLTLDIYPATHTLSYLTYWCYAVMLTDACSNTSVWLTLTFTIERAKRVVIIVAALCFLIVLPTPFEHTVVEEIDKVTGEYRYFIRPSALGNNETYKSIYYWFTSVTFSFLPLTLLAIFNTYLIRSVHESKMTRRKMTMRGDRHENTRQEHRITVMLIAVVIMFLLCQVPYAALLVYSSFHQSEVNTNEFAVERALGNLCNLLLALNAACNFVLYCALSDKYRRTFMRTFMPCFYRRASPSHSLTNCYTSICTQMEADSMANSSLRRGRPSTRSVVARKSLQAINGHNGSSHVNHHNNATENEKERFLSAPINANGNEIAVDEKSQLLSATGAPAMTTSTPVIVLVAPPTPNDIPNGDDNGTLEIQLKDFVTTQINNIGNCIATTELGGCNKASSDNINKFDCEQQTKTNCTAPFGNKNDAQQHIGKKSIPSQEIACL